MYASCGLYKLENSCFRTAHLQTDVWIPVILLFFVDVSTFITPYPQISRGIIIWSSLGGGGVMHFAPMALGSSIDASPTLRTRHIARMMRCARSASQVVLS